MALQRFVKSSGTGDRYRTEDHLNVPVLVQPIELFTGLVSEHDPEGEKVVMRANLYDLEEKQAYGRIVLFNPALVDGLKPYMGSETVIRFADIKKKTGKGTFRGCQEGTDADYALAESMLDDIHAAIEARLEELDSESNGPTENAPKQDEEQKAKVAGAFKR
jgi:hypothetical protein